MASTSDRPGRSPRERRLLTIAAVLLAGAVVYAVGASRDDVTVPTGVRATWAGREGSAPCVYAGGRVEARVHLEGVVPRPQQVTVTVTAYADEDTSRAVGTGRRTVTVDGSVDREVTLTVRVDRAPHVGDDGAAACRLG